VSQNTNLETSISDVIHLACQRNSSLSVCRNSTSTTQSDIRRHQSNNHHNRTFASVTENEPSPIEDDKEKLDTIQIRHEDVLLLRSLLDRLHKEHDEGKPREGDLVRFLTQCALKRSNFAIFLSF
jgi:hypothetical protein